MPTNATTDSTIPRYSAGLFWSAVLTASLVFPLIFVGAGVTSKDAGMAYADWPTSAGHIVNPPEWTKQDDTLWEHGHRLVGWAVGFLALVTAGLGWRVGGHRRTLALTLVGAIILQGVLGGLRVRMGSTPLAMVHGIWGQTCFCLACVTAMISSETWLLRRSARSVLAANTVKRLCAITACVVFLQLVFGAALRHFAVDAATIAHLLWAVAVTLMVGWVCMWLIGDHAGSTILGALSRLLALLMAMQLMLGGTALLITLTTAQWSPLVQWIVPTIHTAVGALMLSTSVLIACNAFRLLTQALPQQQMVDATPSVTTE